MRGKQIHHLLQSFLFFFFGGVGGRESSLKSYIFNQNECDHDHTTKLQIFFCFYNNFQCDVKEVGGVVDVERV